MGVEVEGNFKQKNTYTWSYENRVGKPKLFCNFSQLPLSIISLFLVLFTADVRFFSFFF